MLLRRSEGEVDAVKLPLPNIQLLLTKISHLAIIYQEVRADSSVNRATTY